MTIDRFDPPGGLDDLGEEGLELWSSFISQTVDRAIEGPPGRTNDRPRAQSYNLTKTDTADDAVLAEASWIAFPRAVKVSSVSDQRRWRRADSQRSLQDEYCEWNVTRDAEGRITKVTFTSEGPEYWQALAITAPEALVSVYQQCIDPSVQEDDLFDGSRNYIPQNRWNSTTTNGAMHLIQDANTLSAEIELAAAATIRRVINGEELTGEQELIRCSQYGEPQRNSDPHIGGVVNSVARQKADIALANPVGLYIKDLATDGWETPDGTDPKSFWTPVRGGKDTVVRAVFEVPPELGYTVSDIKIAGREIVFGAQITDFITIKLTAIACRVGQSTVEPMTACVGPDATTATFAALPDPDPVAAVNTLGAFATR